MFTMVTGGPWSLWQQVAHGHYSVRSKWLTFSRIRVNSFPQTLWRLMYNYHQIKQWHDKAGQRAVERVGEVEDGGMSQAELVFNRNYVRQKLEHGLIRVWRVSE